RSWMRSAGMRMSMHRPLVTAGRKGNIEHQRAESEKATFRTTHKMMQGDWARVDIGGKPADVYELPARARPRFALVHLHDAGGKTFREQPAFTRLFDELKLTCVCPHGQQSWWADRVAAEFDPKQTAECYLLDEVMPIFSHRWGLAPRSVGLQGIGMGGQGA